MIKQGRWDEMAAVGTPDQAGRALAAKYGGIADRVALDMPYKHHPDTKLAVAQALRAATR